MGSNDIRPKTEQINKETILLRELSISPPPPPRSIPPHPPCLLAETVWHLKNFWTCQPPRWRKQF